MKEQIIELLKQGRKLEAVATAHRLGGGTLQQAKRYVDAVERETLNGNLPDDNDRVVRSWSVKYNGGKPVSITLRDQYGERQLVEGTLEWNAILAEITQTRNERDTTTEGKDKPWGFAWWRKRNQERMANTNTSTTSKWKFYLLFGLALVLFFGFITFLTDCTYGYVGLLRQAVMTLIMFLITYAGYLLAIEKKEKWYSRLWGVVICCAGCVFGVAFGVALVKDLCTDSLKVYQGEVEVKRHSGRRGTHYTVEWAGDDSPWWADHGINRRIYQDMQGHKKARVEYWQNSGVVKSIQPL
jgi:hypothetical protein